MLTTLQFSFSLYSFIFSVTAWTMKQDPATLTLTSSDNTDPHLSPDSGHLMVMSQSSSVASRSLEPK